MVWDAIVRAAMVFYSLVLIGIGYFLQRIFRRWGSPKPARDDSPKKRIAIIGGGVSGLASAHVFQKRGHQVIVYEKSGDFGGVWSRTYPGTTLQNSYHQYHISDFPFTTPPDLHPTKEQLMAYFGEAVKQLKLDVRINHEVTRMERAGSNGEKWTLQISNEGTMTEEEFDYAVLAVGQYSDREKQLDVAGIEQFQGRVTNTRDLEDLAEFADKEVVVIGNGKTSLDMTVFASKHKAKKVHHVFRTPRWGIPQYLFGVHYTRPLFSRFGSVMMTSWVQPSAFEAVLHSYLKPAVDGFWGMLQKVFAHHRDVHAKGKYPEAKKRLEVLNPQHSLSSDLRSAIALLPADYHDYVARGLVEPYKGELVGFTENEVVLKDGRKIECDMVVTAIGSNQPNFPFLPADVREKLESEKDGTQLYRHVVHPDVPNLGFAGYNHGFVHIPSSEVGALWLSALISGELKLPPRDEMVASIDHTVKWKRQHINHEPSLLCAVNTRYQQYLDVMLGDLGLEPYRKLPNVVAEVFGRYGASDYATVVEEYQEKLASHVARPLPVKT